MSRGHQKEISLTARAAWFMFARTLAFAFSFALPLLLVRRLSQHEFGLYKQVFLVATTAMTTLPFGFGMSAFYFLPREKERQGAVVFNILIFYTVIGGLAFLALVIHPALLETIFNSPELIEYGPVIGLLSLLWMVASFLEIVAIANEESKLATFFIIAFQFAKALLLLATAVSFASVKSLIYAAIIHGVLQTVALVWYLRSRFGPFWKSFSWQVMRMQMSYALPLGFAAFLLRAHSDLHNYFVAYRFDAATFAIYTIGCFNFLLVEILVEAVGTVMIPRVSYLQSENRRREIIELVARMMRKLAAVFFPLYVFLMITGREFITMLFTEQYRASWPIFAINLTMIPLALIASAYDPVVRAYPEQRYFLIRMRAALLVVLMAGLWAGTNRFGLTGAITVVVAVSAIERLVTAYKCGKMLGVTWPDIALLKDLGKIALAAIAAGVVTVAARSLVVGAAPVLVMLVCGITFSIAYLAAIFMLGVISPGERGLIKEKIALLQSLSRWKRETAPIGEEV
ncbi:MAG TPA: oligosaccharide flippase family protein [Blastocatellia bacterium]|jgi:O-antigen/teichoic acid export membrane protein